MGLLIVLDLFLILTYYFSDDLTTIPIITIIIDYREELKLGRNGT